MDASSDICRRATPNQPSVGAGVLSGVPRAVFPTHDGAPPVLVFQVPAHRCRKARAERRLRREAKPCNLAAVHGIAPVMSRTVAHVLNETAAGLTLGRRTAR